MRRLLVLRPEPGATATVKRARELALEPFAVPLFEIEPLEWEAPDAARFDALLLTSANAVRSSGDKLKALRGLPVYAVGGTTGEAAREAGFSIAAVGEVDVDRLLSSIAPDLRLLHLCGQDRKPAGSPSQQITAVPVYEAKTVEAPDLGTVEAAVALIHSPRAGRRFAELVDNRSSISIAAISRAAAEAVGQGWESVESADSPSDDALLALAARLCNKPPPE